MAATVTAPVAEAVTMPRYRFSVEEFELMHEVGIFNEDSPVELIRGEIVEMAAQGTSHVYCVEAVVGIVHEAVGRTLVVTSQSSNLLPNRSMPEPDLAVAVRRGRKALPSPPDILLIGEVSDSSLAYDRREKLSLYAEADIPEAWIFNLVDVQIARYTEPRDGRYHQVAAAGRGERLASTTVPELVFDADDVFGLGEE